MAYSAFPRGSEWRKWDLHCHTPMSGLANEFPITSTGPDWEAYVLALEALSDIPVIGVTDYFLIEGYKNLLEFKKAGRLKNIDLLLPNIEFRLDNFVGQKRVNFHVIFSDKVKASDIEDHFLSDLEIILDGSASGPSNKRKLKRSSLEDMGAKYKSEHPTFKGSDFEVGCTNAVVQLNKIMEILTSCDLFKDQYLTGLAEENLSLMSWDGQDHGIRKTMLHDAHILFSGNPNSIAWCLGKKSTSPKEFVKEFKSLKPCVIGSDAHSLDKIGVAPNSKFTWIKADTTFDGLRQIIYEPEDRVYIGATPPDQKDDAKILESITIHDGKDWFANETIELNRDLTAVIGGKGSGKTAFLDLLGYAGGDFNFDNKESFINKAFDELKGTKVSLKWSDGTTDDGCEIGDMGCAWEEKVRYLSQSFVESLCSFDQHEKLVHQIEDILFQYIPADNKLGARDFVGLKEIKTKSIQLETDRISAQIKKLNGEIFSLESELETKGSLTVEKTRLTKEKADLEGQKPAASNPEEEKEQSQLQKLREDKARLERTIEKRRVTISQIKEFQTRGKLVKSDVEEFNAEIARHTNDWGLESQASQLVFTVPANFNTILNKKVSTLNDEIKVLEGKPDDADKASPSSAITIARIESQMRSIDEKSKLEAQQKRKLMEFGKRIAEIAQRIEVLEKALIALETTKANLLVGKRSERDAKYAEFFVKLDEKRIVLEELYKPLNEPVGKPGERGKVQFFARFNFNAKRFVSQGINLLDGRRSVIRGETGMSEVAEDFWKKVKVKMPQMTNEPITDFTNVLQRASSGYRPFKDQLRTEFNNSDVYDWLYCVDYFDVEYGIKYEGVELNKLSPGRKGVVLLLIYLDIDKDFRPLLIDQPEENLDNRSVYSTLVEYFRKAKKRRQIILVTHNANLVVNADAEQIIVANFELDKSNQNQKIKYVSGSIEYRKEPALVEPCPLERQGIREHVCEILEGGDEAFQRREHKYGFVDR